MGRFTETLENLFRAEIEKEIELHPMWPHKPVQDQIDDRLELLATQFFDSFVHPKKAK